MVPCCIRNRWRGSLCENRHHAISGHPEKGGRLCVNHLESWCREGADGKSLNHIQRRCHPAIRPRSSLRAAAFSGIIGESRRSGVLRGVRGSRNYHNSAFSIARVDFTGHAGGVLQSALYATRSVKLRAEIGPESLSDLKTCCSKLPSAYSKSDFSLPKGVGLAYTLF
jgi:hypothetical protein